MKQPDKRQLIMDSALALFKERGYTNTRIIDIAENAGIGKGTVYAYFKSKEELLVELIGNFARYEYDEFVKRFEDNQTLESGIALYVEFIEGMVEKYGMFAFSFHHNVMLCEDGSLEEIMKIYDEIYIRLFEIVKNILVKGSEPDVMEEEELEQNTVLVMDTVVNYAAAAFSNRSGGNCKVQRPGFGMYRKMTKEKLISYITYGICGKESGHEQ